MFRAMLLKAVLDGAMPPMALPAVPSSGPITATCHRNRNRATAPPRPECLQCRQPPARPCDRGAGAAADTAVDAAADPFRFLGAIRHRGGLARAVRCGCADGIADGVGSPAAQALHHSRALILAIGPCALAEGRKTAVEVFVPAAYLRLRSAETGSARNSAVYTSPSMASIKRSMPCTKALSSVLDLSRSAATQDTEATASCVSPKAPSSSSFSSCRGMPLVSEPGKLELSTFCSALLEVSRSRSSCSFSRGPHGHPDRYSRRHSPPAHRSSPPDCSPAPCWNSTP